MKTIIFNPDHRLVVQKSAVDGNKFKSSFSYLIGSYDQPIGIIGVPYLQDNTFQDKELREFLERLSIVYLIDSFYCNCSGLFSCLNTLRNLLENVSRRMRQTTVDRTNEKIILDDASQEIINLVDSYNSMIDQIEDSAVKLAQSERNHAWREMARQVAHEIKNPLTPMRLTVQSFDHNFDPNDPEIVKRCMNFVSH